jgi:hypothetical protein
MSDHLKAQARSLKDGLEQLDSVIADLEGKLEVARADRLNMAKELGAIERFADAEGFALPYSGKAGV